MALPGYDRKLHDDDMDTVPSSHAVRCRATPGVALPIDQIEAFIFDMDGVVTDTARVHARCWKEVFDTFLRMRSGDTGEPFRPFDSDDYLRYVDGKPRHDGVDGFLSSRQITLELGEPSDPPGYETAWALGNLKEHEFERALAEEGVRPFESTIAFVHALRSIGVRTAMISSSCHAKAIVAAEAIADLFDIIVDGNDASSLELPGKPDPAIFLLAAGQLAVDPSRAAVVEDALAGVEAGRRGGFRLVIGVNRTSQAEALRQRGADVVVNDLAELELRRAGPGRSQ